MKNFVKNVIRTIFKNNGYNLRLTKINACNNEEVMMKQLFDKYSIDLILDVGASRGQYVDSIRKMGYDKDFLCFEPVNAAFDVLNKKFLDDSNVAVVNAAVGSENCDFGINVSECDMCSSVLDVTLAATSVEPATKTVALQPCKMYKLDYFYDVLENNCVAIKIDTQGFESDVILGATETLKLAKMLFVEMSLVELYEGQALFSEVVSMLEDRGFELFAVTPAFLDDSGRMLQVDGLFVVKE